MREGAMNKRPSHELIKRGYSEDEVANIYELGRSFLENGFVRKAQAIMLGLTEVAPEFTPGWLALTYVHIHNQEPDLGIVSARQALRLEPDSTEASLFLSILMLMLGDFNSAGTYLGEVQEKIEAGSVDDPQITRLYKSQLARFDARR